MHARTSVSPSSRTRRVEARRQGGCVLAHPLPAITPQEPVAQLRRHLLHRLAPPLPLLRRRGPAILLVVACVTTAQCRRMSSRRTSGCSLSTFSGGRRVRGAGGGCWLANRPSEAGRRQPQRRHHLRPSQQVEAVVCWWQRRAGCSCLHQSTWFQGRHSQRSELQRCGRSPPLTLSLPLLFCGSLRPG